MAVKVKVSGPGTSGTVSLDEWDRIYSALGKTTLEDTSQLEELSLSGGPTGDIAQQALTELKKTQALFESPELPMPEGEQARLAKRRSLLKQRKRRGRESTILSSPVSLLSEEIGV